MYGQGLVQTAVDSVHPTSAQSDTLRNRFLKGLGYVCTTIDTTSHLHAMHFRWTDAKYAGDMLWRIPGFYLRDLGEQGKAHQVLLNGIDGRGIGLFADGRPITDPATGMGSLYDIPLEAVEEFEVLSPVEALLHGSGAVGGLFNAASRQYDNVRPITNVRHVQGPFEYGLTDGFFTQNVARGINVMAGFQRHVSDGRFDNARLDSWLLRSRVRYNHSDRLNIALSYAHSRSINGINGGVDAGRSRSVYDDLTAFVIDERGAQRISSHHLTLFGIARPSFDEAGAARFWLYSSDFERENKDMPDSTAHGLIRSSTMGARVLYEHTGSFYRVLGGVELERSQTPGAETLPKKSLQRTSLAGRVELTVLNVLSPSVTVREDVHGNSAFTSIGVEALLRAGSSVTLTGEAVWTQRFLSLQEASWYVPPAPSPAIAGSLSKEREHHASRSVRLDVRPGSSFRLSLATHHRTILDAVVFRPHFYIPGFVERWFVDRLTMEGVTGYIELRVGGLEAVATTAYLETKEGNRVVSTVPRWTANGEVAYRGRYIVEAVELRAGLRFRFTGRHRGAQFVAATLVYADPTGPPVGQATTVDVFAVGRIGNAVISVGWENLFNSDYYLVAIYPMPRRTFRLGVNWMFFD